MELAYCRERLSFIKSYEFSATTTKEGGSDVTGSGKVTQESAHSNTLVFVEQGLVENTHGKFKSQNVYRWTFDQAENTISLEHLRFGPEHPVFLFHMHYSREGVWASTAPHWCDRDEYHGKLSLFDSSIELTWDIAKKGLVQEHIQCRYSP